ATRREDSRRLPPRPARPAPAAPLPPAEASPARPDDPAPADESSAEPEQPERDGPAHPFTFDLPAVAAGGWQQAARRFLDALETLDAPQTHPESTWGWLGVWDPGATRFARRCGMGRH